MTAWRTAMLGEVATITRLAVNPSDVDDGTAYVGLENIKPGGTIINVASVGNSDITSTKFRFTNRQVLFGKLRPYLAKIARPEFDGICSTDILPISPSSNLNRDYLAHFLARPEIVTLATSRATGANLPRLSPSELAKFQIPLPPLEEQRRIVKVLDRADELRAKRRKALAQLDSLTQSIFLDMFGDPTKNERNWRTISVGEAGRVQLGRQRAPQYQTGKHTRPYVRVANIHEDRVDVSDLLSMDFNEGDFESYRLRHGDILLNEGQSTELVGRPAMWRNEVNDCCFQNTLVRFQAHKEMVDEVFAFAVFIRYFRSGQFAKISSKTSSVAHLGAGRFSAMPFPTPPLKYQLQFAERAITVNRLKEVYRSGAAELDELFASLQDRAFKGLL